MNSGGGGEMSGTQTGLMKRQYSDKKGVADYIQESEQYPREIRTGAVGQLAGLYGLEGGTGNQQQFIDQAMQSPLYGSIMGNWENSRREGEESIMRNASMTGGMRSGNIQDAMYRYNAEGQNQAQNQALLASYSDQLQGLTGLSQIQAMQSQLPGMYGSNVSTGQAAGGSGGSGGGWQGALSGAIQGGMAGGWQGAVAGGVGGALG